jgi:hypothetical protein
MISILEALAFQIVPILAVEIACSNQAAAFSISPLRATKCHHSAEATGNS